MVVTHAGRIQSFLTTGTAYKFTHQIAPEMDDEEAAKMICRVHWLNSVLPEQLSE